VLLSGAPVEARRPDHGHKWQEGDHRPMRGQQTANAGADAIDQKHPDLPLRGEGQFEAPAALDDGRMHASSLI
jgi:hypothetical protein